MSRRRKNRLALLGLAMAAVAVLATAGLQGTLAYYRTPAELLDNPGAAHQRVVRLGGTVVPGSLRSDGGQVRFRLTADGRAVSVRAEHLPPASFREGQDAVVEGVLGADGTFRAGRVLVRHGNEYRPATEAAG